MRVHFLSAFLIASVVLLAVPVVASAHTHTDHGTATSTRLTCTSSHDWRWPSDRTGTSFPGWSDYWGLRWLDDRDDDRDCASGTELRSLPWGWFSDRETRWLDDRDCVSDRDLRDLDLWDWMSDRDIREPIGRDCLSDREVRGMLREIMLYLRHELWSLDDRQCLSDREVRGLDLWDWMSDRDVRWLSRRDCVSDRTLGRLDVWDWFEFFL